MRFRTLTGVIPRPSPGQAFTYAPSQNERVLFHSIRLFVTADATVGTRTPVFGLLDPTGALVYEAGDPNGFTAGGTQEYILSSLFGIVTSFQGSVSQNRGIPFPKFWLPPGWMLSVQPGLGGTQDLWTGMNFVADYSEDIWHHDQDQAVALQFLSSLAN